MRLMFKCGTCKTLYSVDKGIFLKSHTHHCPNCDSTMPVDIVSFVTELLNVKNKEYNNNWEVYGLPDE